MNFSKFVLELFELSGMSEVAFCQKLNIDKNQFEEIKAGTDESSASVKTLIKAVEVSLFSKTSKAEQDDFVHNKLTQAQAIIVTVGESEHLADHQQTSLSVASEFVGDALKRI